MNSALAALSCKELKLVLDNRNWARRLDAGVQYSCVYLGNDYERLLELKRTAPANCRFIDTGKMLDQASRELRRPYLDYMGTLSLGRASLAWWISRVTEKNVMVSPVYLYVCYLVIIKNLARHTLKAGNICVISQSPALLATIKRLPEFVNYRISGYSGYRASLIISYVKAVLKMFRFIYQSLIEKWSVWRDRARQRTDGPLTVIRTWVGEKNLGKDGTFKDSYFPGLADHLEQQGRHVVILPLLFNVKRSFRDCLRWFSNSKNSFIISEEHYHLSDYLKMIYLSWRSSWLFNGSFTFNGLDLSRIFREEAARNVFGGGTPQVIMQYFLPKRLKQRGLKIEKFIITFENMFPEKPLIMGAAKYLPETKVIGFQHASLFPLLLSCYTSADESTVLPMPDQIVTSGRFFKQILAKEGFPSSKLVDGPALRFQYLLSQASGPAGRPAGAVLLALPLARSSALELLSKVWLAVKDRPGLRIRIKAHPMMSAGELTGILDKAGWSKDRCEIVSGSMAEALTKVSLVIATASAAIFDAVASGVPVIRMRSDVDLSLDPMDWFPADSLSYVARTPAQISSQIDKLLALRQPELLELANKGKELVGQCFAPATGSALAAFTS